MALAKDAGMNEHLAKPVDIKKMLQVMGDRGGTAAAIILISPQHSIVLFSIALARVIRGMDRPDAAAVPIIALSANAFEEDVALAKDAGMNEHLAVYAQLAAVGVGDVPLYKKERAGGHQDYDKHRNKKRRAGCPGRPGCPGGDPDHRRTGG